MNFQIRTPRNVEADIVIPTGEELSIPIGHLSLRVIKGSLIAGNLKIYPEQKNGKRKKEGFGEFNIYLNVQSPPQWMDLKKTEPDDKKWKK